MAGKSPVTASDEQKRALEALAKSKNRREADWARAILLTLKGWTSSEIAQVFCVREDMVRFWRGDVARVGIEGIKASMQPAPDRRPRAGAGDLEGRSNGRTSRSGSAQSQAACEASGSVRTEYSAARSLEPRSFSIASGSRSRREMRASALR